ncbi:vWA domain-containing protein [Alienimonas californiensis]|uniref:VWFA domain-containing protein n=1 Tax=Alienimonas californiensis TaxID=2527989 RepID=A0A517PCJ9_9PLAN|nr:vWA domain-containing protein [Alienimonas californiensis]QDT17104.1 hypothetical protein CA12_32160 [Alienimonas californiensis]
MSAAAIAAPGSNRWAGRKVPLELVALPPVETPSLWERIGTAPAWLVSLAVHVAVLVFLAGITIIVPTDALRTIIESEITPEDIDQFKVDNVLTPEVGNDSSVNVLSPSMAASSMDRPIEQEFQQEVEMVRFDASLPTANAVEVPNNEVLTTMFDAEGMTENTGGVEGAIDVLTREIASHLRENETTVVWMLDASLSLEDRRNALAERFEAVYAQLGNTGDVDTNHLRTAVATFGEGVNLLTTEAVVDVAPLVAMIREVPPDESGKENVFTALKAVGSQMLPERTREKRTLMFVIVTDEKGDDDGDLENVIAQFKRYGVPVYVVGNAAPFGRDKGYVTYRWKEGEREFRLPIPVDAGPETVMPERIRLGFWGPGGEVENERLSSGYGPYALTRLCVETGGMYLVADDTNQRKFEPQLMRSYGPDYRPIKDYTRDVMANGAKRALIEAAQMSTAEEIPNPQLVFAAVDDTRLRREITEAQKPMAVVSYRLSALQAKLEAGLPDRPKVEEPRWRAGFDLALGRVYAQQARALGYNTVLAQMKSDPLPFERENSNEWILRGAPESDAGSEVKKLIRQSSELLSRVIDEHPGTPWARLAEKELATPLGWEWRERNNEVLRAVESGVSPAEAAKMFAPEEERERMRRQMQGEQGPQNVPKL